MRTSGYTSPSGLSFLRLPLLGLALSCAGYDDARDNADALNADAQPEALLVEAPLVLQRPARPAERQTSRVARVQAQPESTYVGAAVDEVWRDVRRGWTRAQARLATANSVADSGGLDLPALGAALGAAWQQAASTVNVCNNDFASDTTALECWSDGPLPSAALRALPRLTSLVVALDALSDPEQVAALPNLEVLTVYLSPQALGGDAVLRPDLQRLAELPRLRSLSVVLTSEEYRCGQDDPEVHYAAVELDMSVFANTALRELIIDGGDSEAGGPVLTVRGLHAVQGLEGLVLRGSQVEPGDVPAASALTSLTISRVGGADPVALASASTRLTSLELEVETPMQLAQLVASAPNLESLTLLPTSLSDLSALRNLHALRELYVAQLPVSDAGFLRGLHLVALDVSYTSLRSLREVVRHQPGLVNLAARGVTLQEPGMAPLVTQLSPLVGLKQLQTLSLSVPQLELCSMPEPPWAELDAELRPACRVLHPFLLSRQVEVTLVEGCGC